MTYRPPRSLTDAAQFPGSITATPKSVLNKLAIRRLVLKGVSGVGRSRRSR